MGKIFICILVMCLMIYVVLLLALIIQGINIHGNSTLALYYYQSACAGCVYLDNHVFSNSTVIEELRELNITLVKINLDDPSNLRFTTLEFMVDRPSYVVTVGSSSPIDNPLSSRYYPVMYIDMLRAEGDVKFSVQYTPTIIILKLINGTPHLSGIIVGAPSPQQFIDIVKMINQGPQQNNQEFPIIISMVLSYLAGVESAVMPCSLPVIIASLGMYVGGLRRMGGVLLGLIVTYSALGTVISYLGSSLGGLRYWLYVLSASVLVIMGLVLAIDQIYGRFSILISRLQRLSIHVRPEGFLTSLLLGVILTGLWMPCLAPLMASVLAGALISSISGNQIYPILISLMYALGLASVIMAITRIANKAKLLPRKGRLLERISGVVLVSLGVLLLLT